MNRPSEARQVQQATDLALRFMRLLHAGQPEAAHALTAGLDRHGLRLLVAVTAAMLPERTDPRAALAWVDSGGGAQRGVPVGRAS